MISLVLLVACRSTTPSTPSTGGGPRLPDLPPSACQDFDYLPLDDMGSLVVSQAAPELSLDPDALGEVLDLLGAGTLAPVTYGVDTWRIRYTTQDRGRATEATGVVIVPRLPEPATVPLVLWEHYTSGSTDVCAPSAMGALGEGLPMAFAAKLGVVVVAPDYLGMNGLGAPADQLHPYVIGEPTAIASLDAARAGLALADQEALAVRPDPSRTVVWGISQGGHAALWVDRFAPAYAPELKLAAVVAVVPPSNVVALADHGLEAWSDTSETMVAVSATTADWYGLDLDDALLPDVGATVLDQLHTTCNVLDPSLDLDALDEVYTPTFLAARGQWDAVLPDWGCAFRANTVVDSPIPRTSGAPLMMVLAEDDTLAWSPPALEDAHTFCDQGIDVSLLECAGLDHEDAATASLDRQLAWVSDRLAGVPVEDACALPPPEDCGTAR